MNRSHGALSFRRSGGGIRVRVFGRCELACRPLTCLPRHQFSLALHTLVTEIMSDPGQTRGVKICPKLHPVRSPISTPRSDFG